MQKTFLLIVLFGYLHAGAQSVGIGTNAPHSSAQLEVNSSSKGMLIPRMTTVQRDAIVTPAMGLQIFNLDDQCTDIFDGKEWIKNCGLKVTGYFTTDTGHATPDSWTRKANFPGPTRLAGAGFSIGGKGYIGTGSYLKDFWEYDTASNSWTQKADFGGVGRWLSVSFSINGKGYISTGDAGIAQNDTWEYNPNTNSWTKRADFPGEARYAAIGFSIGNKGYLGTGIKPGGTVLKDFWEYDPATDSWAKKADFPTPRTEASGFSIGTKGYLIGGSINNEQFQKDFWEYDPSANVWTRKADFVGGNTRLTPGFAIGNKGYYGGGNTEAGFWMYNPETDTWQQKADFKGGARSGTTGFAIGNKGFIGVGDSIFAGGKNDFWEYMDDNVTGYQYSSNPVSTSNNTVSDGAWTIAGGTVYNANPGNVGIGTTSPAQKLEVAGKTKTTGLQVTAGAVEGALLTSDASGNANWKPADKTGCVIRATNWNAPASGTGYTGHFTAASFTASGIFGDTRLQNSGSLNTTISDAQNSGVFTAPADGYYLLNLLVRSVASSSRLLIIASLNGQTPMEIFDMLTTNPCANCSDISHSQIIYLNAGDTHRVMRHIASTGISDMIVSYRRL